MVTVSRGVFSMIDSCEAGGGFYLLLFDWSDNCFYFCLIGQITVFECSEPLRRSYRSEILNLVT